MKTKTEKFSRGFYRGNYANAYECQDWGTWYADHCTDIERRSDEYQEGLLLGFFSSYEIDEISDPTEAETVAQLRSDYGEDA